MLGHHYLKVDIFVLRNIFSWILLIIALLLIPLSIILFWLKFTIFDSDQFVKTLSPISKNPYIIESLSVNLSDNFFQNINAEEKIRESLPDKSKFLAPSLVIVLKNFTAKESATILTSDAFNTLWEKTLRISHQYLIKVLTGEGEINVNNKGQVYLDFSDAVNKLEVVLLAKGITIFENAQIDPKIMLFKSEKLAYLQNILRFISVLGAAFPIIVGLLTAGAVLIAVKRIKFLIWVGAGIIVSSIMLLLLINSGENYFINLAGNLDREATRALYQILTDPLRQMSIKIAALGLIITLFSTFLVKSRLLKKWQN